MATTAAVALLPSGPVTTTSTAPEAAPAGKRSALPAIPVSRKIWIPAAALILLALDVPESTVIADHALSNIYNAAVIQNIKKEIRKFGIDPEDMRSYLSAPREAIEAVGLLDEVLFGAAERDLVADLVEIAHGLRAFAVEAADGQADLLQAAKDLFDLLRQDQGRQMEHDADPHRHRR